MLQQEFLLVLCMMMNRDLRTRLDLLKPDIASHVHNEQADQKQYSDNR